MTRVNGKSPDRYLRVINFKVNKWRYEYKRRESKSTRLCTAFSFLHKTVSFVFVFVFVCLFFLLCFVSVRVVVCL